MKPDSWGKGNKNADAEGKRDPFRGLVECYYFPESFFYFTDQLASPVCRKALDGSFVIFFPVKFFNPDSRKPVLYNPVFS